MSDASLPPTSIPSPSRAPRRSRYWPLLALLTLAVLLAHWGLLQGGVLVLQPAADPQGAVTRAFTTRTIHMASSAPVVPAVVAVVRPRPAKSAAPALAQPDGVLESNQAVDLVDTAQAAIETIATDVADGAPAAEPAAPAATAMATAQSLRIPGSTRLKYDINGEVNGFRYYANGELLWLHDGITYDARLEISHFLLGSRVQTSKGQLTALGLEPIRFGDKVRSEVAAHFERSKNKVSFSANTPDAPLLPGAQDQLSVFLQLAAMLGGDADRFSAGTHIAFQAVGPRSSEAWDFVVGAAESMELPGGRVKALKLTREPTGENDPKVEVWFAAEMDYVPVRIRLSQSNGDFVEQQWHSTQKP